MIELSVSFLETELLLVFFVLSAPDLECGSLDKWQMLPVETFF